MSAVECESCSGRGFHASRGGAVRACGLAFDHAGRVVLVRKRRPFWRAGLLGGVDCEVRPGESPAAAMEREFFEKTGVPVSCGDWRTFHVDRSGGSPTHFLVAQLPCGVAARSATDEAVCTLHWEHWPYTGFQTRGCMPDLGYLVPMARWHITS